jgi:tRNA(Ile)-lysidine synthase
MLDRVTIERMAVKAGEGPILVALSGGGDSVALLHLLVETFGAARLRAIVVDHALREGSADDARRARGFAEALGVEADVLTLLWAEGENRGQQAAREARYRVLSEAARRLGAQVIATGHTRDDQAETVFMRAARGASVRGLAGMRALAPVPVWPEGRGLWLARPLLGARRGELRAYLNAKRAAWIEDPANSNDAYERVRARRTLAAMDGLDPMRFAALAERLAPFATAIDEAAFQLITASTDADMGSIGADRAAFGAADSAVRQRALTVLVTAAGGHARGPGAEQIARLDAAILAADFEAMTLGGAVVRARGGVLQFTRDRGGLAGRADGTPALAPLALPAGVETVWDGRVALTIAEPGWSVVVEEGAVKLARAEERAALAAALPHWLIRTRVKHMLGCD